MIWVNTFDFVNQILKTAKFLLGLFGIILATPLLLPGVGALYFTLLRANIKINRLIQGIYDSIPNMEDKDLIECHLMFERAYKELSISFKSKFQHSNFYLYKPVRWQLRKFIVAFKSAEQVLRKAAYPNLTQMPPKKQIERLLKTYSEVQDWDNDDYDIYEKEYL